MRALRAKLPLMRLRCCCRIALLAALPFAALAKTDSETAPRARHVVLIVWDGMRPDFVSAENTPQLWQLAQAGVTFRRHHSVYPSLTSVNATALATGVFPQRSGVIANWAFRPDLAGEKPARMDDAETIRKGDALTEGHYLGAPTIAELVRAAGGQVAVAGTKSAGLLHDRRPRGPGAVTIFKGESEPPSALDRFVKLLGQFPAEGAAANGVEDEWTTRALTEVFWAEGVPRFSVLWMSDPDHAQHATMPGSPEALAALRSVDHNLGRVLAALEEKGVRAATDVLVASDHGFSTIARRVDLKEFLGARDFHLAGKEANRLAPGEIKVVGNGGVSFLYVGEHETKTIARLVEALQQSDVAGPIFAREKIAGTFTLAELHLDAANGPDVIVPFRWTRERNRHGVAGLVESSAGTDNNLATHGSLSPFDLHNTCIAAGPDFRPGLASDLPSSNLDVAATIMHLLQLQPPEPLDGRVLHEALVPSAAAAPTERRETVRTEREFPGGTWEQTLELSHAGGRTYIDEGRARFEAKK